MVNIEELYRKINSSDIVDGIDLHANIKSIVSELLDRLKAAKTAWKEADKACRDLTEKVIPNLRESLESAEKERDILRTKVEAMERQEPVWFIDERGEPKRYHKSKADYCKYGGLELLYTLPGAKETNCEQIDT